MGKYIKMVLFLGVIATPCSLLAATPTISNVSGTVATGQTLTISGSNMVQENKTDWDPFFNSHPSTAYSFEGSTPTSDGWNDIGGGGQKGTYDSNVKLLGNKSVRYHSEGAWPEGPGGLGDYNAINPSVTDGDNGEIWVRFYSRWNLLGGSWPTNYMKVMDTQGSPVTQYYLDIAGTSAGQPQYFNAAYDSASHNVAIPGGPLKNNRWYLIEIHWKASSVNTYQLWVDGQQILNVSPQDQSTVNYLLFGIINLAGTASNFSLDEWIDGLAFGSSRVYPASVVEVSGDGINWKYQEPLKLSDTSSQIKLDLSGLTGTNYRLRVTNNQQQTSAVYTLSGSTGTPPDTTPPAVSNPLPSGTVSYGTTQANLQVTTSESSTCKYGTTNLSYASLPNTFTTTGNLQHSQTVTGLSNGGSYTYYVHCRDTAGNIDTSNKVITFTISGTNPSQSFIFQDNFDNCTQNCVASQLAAPSGWTQWYGPQSATVGGITHYSGEISSPGRGGSGKSLKTWRAGSTFGTGYTGSFAFNNFGTPPPSEIYMRYYVKLPTDMDLSSSWLKLWRLGNTGPSQEIYLDLMGNAESLRDTGVLQVMTNNHGWDMVLNHTDLAAIWDNNWHCWEWHINLSTGLLEFWVDGVRKYSDSNWNFGGGTFNLMQHFSVGNYASGLGAWQPSWQAMEFDDFVFSTRYIGPDGSTGGNTPTDTTPPAVPTGLSVM